MHKVNCYQLFGTAGAATAAATGAFNRNKKWYLAFVFEILHTKTVCQFALFKIFQIEHVGWNKNEYEPKQHGGRTNHHRQTNAEHIAAKGHWMAAVFEQAFCDN